MNHPPHLPQHPSDSASTSSKFLFPKDVYFSVWGRSHPVQPHVILQHRSVQSSCKLDVTAVHCKNAGGVRQLALKSFGLLGTRAFKHLAVRPRKFSVLRPQPPGHSWPQILKRSVVRHQWYSPFSFNRSTIHGYERSSIRPFDLPDVRSLGLNPFGLNRSAFRGLKRPVNFQPQTFLPSATQPHRRLNTFGLNRSAFRGLKRPAFFLTDVRQLAFFLIDVRSLVLGHTWSRVQTFNRSAIRCHCRSAIFKTTIKNECQKLGPTFDQLSSTSKTRRSCHPLKVAHPGRPSRTSRTQSFPRPQAFNDRPHMPLGLYRSVIHDHKHSSTRPFEITGFWSSDLTARSSLASHAP
ncbi:hypothetical protein LR48_Vigan03g139600 [Vigna angularis]|uniref:Uncharacterized protein n=1 Tax=Phaseolus angularis TaxID=3914 RepID=A0A0L9U6I0_PHAAN|nr:hypothetical protein LR48_Vigan03g139600 [Vigna angularis]